MPTTLNLLIAEDSVADAEFMLREVQRAGFAPNHRRVEDAPAFVAALQDGPWDIVLSDYTMPQFHGLEALRLLRASGRDIPLLIVTGTINEETAVECLKQGADDYVLKENLARLGPAVRRALREYEERRQRRGLEEQLRHAQRIETVGTLAAGLAHDFNNMLTAVYGHVDLIRAETPADSPIRAHLAAVERAAQRAAGITRALLTFSRRASADKRYLPLNDVCHETARLIAHLLPASIAQEWDVPQERLCVLGDTTQLQQVLLNLVVNARDAMPEGGTVRVSLTRCTTPPESARLQPTPPTMPLLCLSVTDTGVGLSSEVRGHLFEPFFTTKPRGQGTGLGLAIVHGIAADHGGWIDVESQPGAGATFSVYLPCASDTVAPTAAEPSTLTAAPPDTGVLIIEDDELVRSVVATFLESAGYRVLQANDGIEGLKSFLVHRDAIRIVIADLELPGISGVECLTRITATAPDVRGLLITGQAGAPKSLAPGAGPRFPVLTKPFQMNDLCRLVGSLARQRSALSP